MAPLTFEIKARSIDSEARLGRVTTGHGEFDTPTFMPVGTQATVKGLTPAQVRAGGAQIILANTYHLMLRPGSELIAQMGGLHKWMCWSGPILTDSGGYQVFSLADILTIGDHAVQFRSHLDGATVELSPLRAMEVQNQLGADIIMALDDCPPPAKAAPHHQKRIASHHRDQIFDTSAAGSVNDKNIVDSPQYVPPDPAHKARVAAAAERTLRWLDLCVKAHGRPDEQALFGIVQGGTDLQRRSWCAERVIQHDLPGYAIGGVAVGESQDLIASVVAHTARLLPPERPRYLMGVGYEQDILAAVRSGVDMFDCVLPTRNGRNGNAFTRSGQIRLRNAKFAYDDSVIEPDCDCGACARGFSRSYLRHLLLAREMLGPMLISIHNLHHFHHYLLDIRRAIEHNDWSLITRAWPVTI